MSQLNKDKIGIGSSNKEWSTIQKPLTTGEENVTVLFYVIKWIESNRNEITAFKFNTVKFLNSFIPYCLSHYD